MAEEFTFEAADVPALRADLASWLRDGRGLGFHSDTSSDVGTMIGRPQFDGDRGLMRAYAEMVCEQEQRTLRDAELFFVTAEMTEVVRAAAATMSAFAPDPDDFPTPAGLIVFEEPLVRQARRTGNAAVIVDGRLAVDQRGQDFEQVSISACTWGPFRAAKWAHGGVFISFYRDRREMLADLLDDRLRDDIRPTLPRLVPDNECGIAYHEGPAKDRLEEDLRERDTSEYTSNWAKYLLTTLLLMRQPLVYQRAEPVRRGLRRRLERAGYPTRDIRILDARPRRYDTVPAPAADGDAGAETGQQEVDGQGRKVTVRYPVRGFWRNQWYPSRGVHRPRWIDPHWRGPEDGEIVGADRVRVLRGHREEGLLEDLEAADER